MKKVFLTSVFILFIGLTQGLHAQVFEGTVYSSFDTSFNLNEFLNRFQKPRQDRTYLGVETTKDDKGAKIVSVAPGSPAEKAGLKKDDIITGVEGKTIDGPEKLSEVIRGLKPDQKVKIDIVREGKKSKVSAVLGVTSDNVSGVPGLRNFRFRIPNPYGGSDRIFDGSEFFKPKPELGMQVQDTEDDSGVAVLKVTEGSPADKAGVKEGDVVTELNEKKVSNVSDIQKAIRETRGSEYKIQVLRNKRALSLTVKIPKELKKADL